MRFRALPFNYTWDSGQVDHGWLAIDEKKRMYGYWGYSRDSKCPTSHHTMGMWYDPATNERPDPGLLDLIPLYYSLIFEGALDELE